MTTTAHLSPSWRDSCTSALCFMTTRLLRGSNRKQDSIRDIASLGKTGRPGGTRTPNLRFWRPLLCQLSYWPVCLQGPPLQRPRATAGAMIAKPFSPGNPFRHAHFRKKKKRRALARLFAMELMDGFEPSTSPLPRVCSTPELHERLQPTSKRCQNTGAGSGDRTRIISLEG